MEVERLNRQIADLSRGAAIMRDLPVRQLAAAVIGSGSDPTDTTLKVSAGSREGVVVNSVAVVGGVHLIDPEGKKKYFVARDSEGKCVCSAFVPLKPGERVNHWGRFAAPPETVERLTVVIPPFAPMDDVPVSR